MQNCKLYTNKSYERFFYIVSSKKPMRDQRISFFVLTLKIKLIAIVRFDTYNFHKNGYFQLKYIAIFKASLCISQLTLYTYRYNI
jgi:hypothetical protein